MTVTRFRSLLRLCALACLVLTTADLSAGWVKGYTRKDGTYVRGHYRSSGGGGYRLGTGSSTSSVSVRGYWRGGTWVAPHRRSRADGNPWNNWSTVGNVNPYTGKPGTRHPYGAGGFGASGLASRGRSSDGSSGFTSPWAAERGGNASEPGTFSSPWAAQRDRTFASSAPRDRESGDAVAASDAAGVAADADFGAGDVVVESGVAEPGAEPVNRLPPPPPFDGSFTVLSPSGSPAAQPVRDSASDAIRMRMAGELRDLGHPVMWQEHTYSEMSDMADRIRKARELERAGVSVDWQKYSWHQLCDMLSRRRAG